MIHHLLMLAGGLGLLFAGATALVRGGASLALRLRINALVVGLTIVAYGTSMPELLVSARAALAGQGDIALGNVIGSNIFNIAVILGLAAVLCPLRVQFQLIRLDTPLLLLVTGGFGWFFRDREISRAEAAVLCAGLVGYTLLNLHLARRTATETVTTEFDAALPRPSRHWAVDVGLIAGGLGLLVLGARLLVDSASALARGWGVSEAVIGLTIVAAGTSLPELATTLVAALRKQPDIAVGNVVGSNLYNLLAIAGISGLLAPLAGPGIRVFDLVTLMVLTVILFPLLWTGLMVKRWEGGVLLGSYAVYLAVLWPK
jgi:cation:H+ antiporter